jgi:hypothetical protein
MSRKGVKERVTAKVRSQVAERARKFGYICECSAPNHKHTNGHERCINELPRKLYFHPTVPPSWAVTSSSDVIAVCKNCAAQFRVADEEICQ